MSPMVEEVNTYFYQNFTTRCKDFFQYFLTPHPWTNGKPAAFDHLEEVNHRNNKRNTSFFGLGAFVNQRLPIYVILILQVLGTKLFSFFWLKNKTQQILQFFQPKFRQDALLLNGIFLKWHPKPECFVHFFGEEFPSATTLTMDHQFR